MTQQEHSRIKDKTAFAGRAETEGVPDEEGVEETDVRDRLDEDPEQAQNRRDVPDPPTETVTPPAAEQ